MPVEPRPPSDPCGRRESRPLLRLARSGSRSWRDDTGSEVPSSRSGRSVKGSRLGRLREGGGVDVDRARHEQPQVRCRRRCCRGRPRSRIREPVTPWLRMHTEVANICCFCCSDACADGPPTGSSLRQAACAASNAGEARLMPVPPRLIPPLGWGSGNAVTRWLRMHSEKARKDRACEEALGLWPDEPQAAIATAQITEGSTISTLRPFRLTMDLGCCGPRTTPTLTPSRCRFDR